MAGEGHPRGENGGGGPKTEAGRARALANLQSPPEKLAATKHGLGRFLSSAIAPPCRVCIARTTCDRFRDGDATCIVAEEYQAQVIADLMVLPQIQAEDEPIVREYSKWATALLILDKYIANASPLLPGSDQGFVDVQPALKERVKISSHLLKCADALGLSPAARAKLKVSDRKDNLPAIYAAALAAASEARNAGAVDADFTEEHNGSR